MLVQTFAACKLFLAILLADVTTFTGKMKVRLFQNNIVPTPATTIADLTEATFDGYAASTVIVWSPAGVDDSGFALAIGDMKLFQMSGSTTPNLIYGYYVCDDAGPPTKLYWAELLPTPKSMTALGDQLGIVPEYDFANQT